MGRSISRAKLGKRSRTKGASFERKIANELREIYDPSELVAEMIEAAADKDMHRLRVLHKESCVSRGEQARGAKHPDILCLPCPFWLELQDAKGSTYNPLRKLEQAESDCDTEQWPASVCHQTGKHSIQVCMRYKSLRWLISGERVHGDPTEIPVVIDWEAFKDLLRRRHART